MITLDGVHALYGYQYAFHHRLWDSIMTLSDAAFLQDVPYSIGSLRNHVVHLASVDQRWFARVLDTPLPEHLVYGDYPTRAAARVVWDSAEQRVRAALDQLTEADLTREITSEFRRTDPTPHTITAQNAVWQILVHVVNHGTDHRAQMLRILHDLGAPTFPNDIMAYWWDL